MRRADVLTSTAPRDADAVTDGRAWPTVDLRAIGEVPSQNLLEPIVTDSAQRLGLIGKDWHATLLRWWQAVLTGSTTERENLERRASTTAAREQGISTGLLVSEVWRRSTQLRRSMTTDAHSTLDVLAQAEADLVIETASLRPSSTDKLVRLGLVAGMIGHELRNPLGVVLSSAALLRRKAEPGSPAQRHAEKIERNAKACGHIIGDLLDLARDRPPRVESLSLRDQLERARIAADMTSEVMLNIEVPPTLRLTADAGLLERALVNVLRNADAAMKGKGTLEVRAQDIGDVVEISMTDDGPGFDDTMLEADPFAPLNTSRTQGVGLGLALVREVVVRHAGDVRAFNVEHGGACVLLRFPKEPA